MLVIALHRGVVGQDELPDIAFALRKDSVDQGDVTHGSDNSVPD
jgi:hypothetical protein